VGAYVGANDLKRAARVLRRLSEFIAVRLSGAPDGDGGRRAGPAVSVIVSGWGRWVGALRTSRWGWAEEVLHDIVRDGASAGITAVISGARELTTNRFFPLVPNRLYFPLGATQESLLTWPKLPPMDALPGRCLAQGPISSATGAVGQLALGSNDAAHPCHANAVRPAVDPYRMLPLPAVVLESFDTLATSAGGLLRVPIGLGGDELDVVFLELPQRTVFLVIGSSRSGRTTLVERIAAEVPAETVCLRPAPTADPDAYWRELVRSGLPSVQPPDSLLLVDDADHLSPETQRHLTALFTQGYRMILTVLEGPSVLTKVPLATYARAARTGIVLGPHRPSDGDFFGVRLDCDALPNPGRGFLIGTRDPIEVQVALTAD